MSSSRQRQTGFALPAVLAVVGVVTLIFLVAITALSSLTAEARSARARVRFLETAMSAEARIQYLAATEPLRLNGFQVGASRVLNEVNPEGGSPAPGIDPSVAAVTVRADGRAYRLGENDSVIVRLQDQAGLINVAALSPEASRRLYERIGIPAARQDTVRARLIDYTDADELSQINGAEGGAYPDGRPPNRNLRRPSELLSVLDVRPDVKGVAWRGVRSNLAADPQFRSINVNTLTPLALEIVLGLSPAQAQAVVRTRETTTFFRLDTFTAVAGNVLLDDGDSFYVFPSSRLVYQIADTRSPWIYRGRLTLTPQALERPLWVDQTEQIEAPGRAVANPEDALEFPFTPG